MPIAPGKLHRRKAKIADTTPACIIAIVKSILVEAGPGKAWQMAKISWYYVSVSTSVRMLIWDGPDRLFVKPFNASAKPQTLDKTSVEDLEMYRWSTKRSEAKVPHPHKDLSQTSS
jgi:hypothetical protein